MKNRGKQFAFHLILGILALGLFCSNASAEEVVFGFTGPLSGPGSGYGRDNANGIQMAVDDINKAGGINVGGKNYTISLQTFDDMIDPTAAVNNAQRLRSRSGARVIWNPVFNTIAPLMQINEQPGSEFLLMAYSSTPKIDEMENELTSSIPPPFIAYVRAFSDIAWEKGWRKGAMVVTLGAYGDEWREAFREHWVHERGGEILADKPANYYTDTDFSSQISSAISTKPDFLLIGGPSEPTGLVIEQARNLGFKGGFILVDQAKMDYIANVVFDGDLSLMDNVVGIAPVADVPSPIIDDFTKRYKEKFNVHNTWEAILNYSSVHIVTAAMEKAGTVDDPKAIKAAIPKILPQDPEKVPATFAGTRATKLLVPGTVGYIEDGKYQEPIQYIWWAKDQAAFEKALENVTTGEGIKNRMMPVEGYLE